MELRETNRSNVLVPLEPAPIHSCRKNTRLIRSSISSIALEHCYVLN